MDEALTILLLYIPEENRPSKQAIAPLRKAIVSFLNILDYNFTKEADTNATFPKLAVLREAGISLINDKEKFYDPYSRRRELISVMLSNEGWQFEDIYKHKSDPEQDA